MSFPTSSAISFCCFPAQSNTSISYRERYKEFLKIDFPRIPYPENAEP
ncbi:MAG: hypothetical protein LBS16_06605 [Prevotellaceae bacterium]|nr:hypothetical protein [Prevotellaceae bacterium]